MSVSFIEPDIDKLKSQSVDSASNPTASDSHAPSALNPTTSSTSEPTTPNPSSTVSSLIPDSDNDSTNSPAPRHSYRHNNGGNGSYNYNNRSQSAFGSNRGLKPALARSSSSSAVPGSHTHFNGYGDALDGGHGSNDFHLNPSRFSTQATINNTNSNSLLFKRRHSEDSPNTRDASRNGRVDSVDDGSHAEMRKRSSSRRRIPTASSRSSSLGRSRSRDDGRSRERSSRRNSSVDIGSKKNKKKGGDDDDDDDDDDYDYEYDDDDDAKTNDDPFFEELEDTPFFKRVAFDTINIKYHDDKANPSSSFRFTKPSFSSIGVGNWRSSSPFSSKKDDDDVTFNSFSISSKHEDFKATYGSRTFLCALSSVSTSWRALQWLVEKVMEDGDELLCLKVEKEPNKPTSYYKTKSEDVLTQIVHTIVASTVKKINVIVELSLGSVRHIVRQAVLLYQPAIVMVGTSLKQYQKVMRYMSKKNTLSNFFINHSPVPVIVMVQEMVDKHDKLPDGSSRHTLGDIMDILKEKKKQKELETNNEIPTIVVSGSDGKGGDGTAVRPSIPIANGEKGGKKKGDGEGEEEDNEDDHRNGFQGLLPRARENSAISPCDYLSYLTAREQIEVDYDDTDTRQNYRSLFADWDKDGNFIDSSATNSPKTGPTTNVGGATGSGNGSGTGSLAGTPRLGGVLGGHGVSASPLSGSVTDLNTTTTNTSTSDKNASSKPSSQLFPKFKMGYQINKKKGSADGNDDSSDDPHGSSSSGSAFSPGDLLSPSKSVGYQYSSNTLSHSPLNPTMSATSSANYSRSSSVGNTHHDGGHLSAQRTNSSMRSLSTAGHGTHSSSGSGHGLGHGLLSVHSGSGNGDAEGSGKTKRRKSFFGSLLRRKSGS